MNGHCSTCPVEKDCAYEYKPCDCRDQLKFKPMPQPAQQSCYCLNCEELSKQVTALKLCVEVERGFHAQEQPAQREPVEWTELLREARDNCKASIVEEGISASRKEYRIDLEARLTAALNTSPQPAQRTWVGLTQQERKDIWRDAIGWGDPSHDDIGLMIAIEAKLKEKNNV